MGKRRTRRARKLETAREMRRKTRRKIAHELREMLRPMIGEKVEPAIYFTTNPSNEPSMLDRLLEVIRSVAVAQYLPDAIVMGNDAHAALENMLKRSR